MISKKIITSIFLISTLSTSAFSEDPVFKYDHLECFILTTDNQPALKFELHPADPYGNNWILHADERIEFKRKNFQVTATLELKEERVVKMALGLAEVKNENGKESFLWKSESGTFSTYPNAPDFWLTVRGYPSPVDFSSPYVYFEYSCYTKYKEL